jgi:ubiquinone/menaquinone biosynthesis C-methylase UbiE
MRRFLRKSSIARDPLAVAMSGVRLGERALQIGEGNARDIALIAAKTGLTGTAAIVVPDDHAAVRVRREVTEAATLADVRVVSQPELPFDDATFDVVVVHDVTRTIAAPDRVSRGNWVRECRRLLRDGGRIVTIEPGTPVGLRALFGGGQKTPDAGSPSDTTASALGAGGFKAVRPLGDREGLQFFEGVKTD